MVGESFFFLRRVGDSLGGLEFAASFGGDEVNRVFPNLYKWLSPVMV